jgi:uncharacterized membrane protein
MINIIFYFISFLIDLIIYVIKETIFNTIKRKTVLPITRVLQNGGLSSKLKVCTF